MDDRTKVTPGQAGTVAVKYSTPLIPLKESMFKAAARFNDIQRHVIEELIQGRAFGNISAPEDPGATNISASQIFDEICSALEIFADSEDDRIRIAVGKYKRYQRMIEGSVNPVPD